MKIRGKTALVTGASSGIGYAIAGELAARGAKVILVARNGDELNILTAAINASNLILQTMNVEMGTATYYQADLSKSGALDSLQASPDIIVNAAGSGEFRFITETDPAQADAMMACPYGATFNTVRRFLPDMLARNSGMIVNITSPAAFVPWPGATVYTVARWAVRGFTEALRADLRKTNIKVMLVVPGKTNSNYFKNNPGSEERIPKISKLISVLTPQQVARAVAVGIKRNQEEVVIPIMLRLFRLMHRFFPKTVQRLVTKTGYQKLV